jgi:hypothetical protein
MKYFVKIVKSSIKPNPNAGSSTTIVRESQETTFKYTGKDLPGYLIEGKNCVTVAWNTAANMRELILNDHSLVEKLLHQKGVYDLKTDYNNIKLNHEPLPRYNYVYHNTIIDCYYCEKTITRKELKIDSINDGYSDTICPRCGAWDCCELEYEDINTIKIN